MGKWDEHYKFGENLTLQAKTIGTIITKLIITYFLNKYCNKMDKYMILIYTSDQYFLC